MIYYSTFKKKIIHLTSEDIKSNPEKLFDALKIESNKWDKDEIAFSISVAEKRIKVRKMTDDSSRIAESDKFAFNDADLAELFGKGVEYIYLCGDMFTLTNKAENVKLVGFGNVTPKLKLNGILYNEFKKRNITLDNVYLAEEKLYRVMSITNDEKVIDNYESVAFDNAELNRLIDENKSGRIYLYGNKFTPKYVKKNITLIGVGESLPQISFGNYDCNAYTKAGFRFENCCVADYATKGVGEVFQMGVYNGEPMEWVVVEKDAGLNRMLVIARKSIGSMQYRPFKNMKDNRWETSAIRKYLNDEFYSEVLIDNSKYILTTQLITFRKNLRTGSTDKIFILGLKELGLDFFIFQKQFSSLFGNEIVCEKMSKDVKKALCKFPTFYSMYIRDALDDVHNVLTLNDLYKIRSCDSLEEKPIFPAMYLKL